MTFRGWVNSVGEIQLWLSSNSLQKKRDEDSLMLLGKLGKDGSESVEIFASPVWWNEHSGNDQLDIGILSAGSRENLVEILTRGLEGDAAKCIVSAQCEN